MPRGMHRSDGEGWSGCREELQGDSKGRRATSVHKQRQAGEIDFSNNWQLRQYGMGCSKQCDSTVWGVIQYAADWLNDTSRIPALLAESCPVSCIHW